MIQGALSLASKMFVCRIVWYLCVRITVIDKWNLVKNSLTVWNISGFQWDAMKKKIETGFTL